MAALSAVVPLWLLLAPGRVFCEEVAETGAYDDDQPEPGLPGEEILVEEPRVELHVMPGTTVTVIDVDQDSQRMLSLGDILPASPGLYVRTAGGIGSMQTLRMRGASGSELRVLVDGVPVAQDSVGALDLSSLPLDNVVRIEVFRGNLPAGLGAQGIAGAINLVTTAGLDEPTLRLDLGAGSFHTYQGSLNLGGPLLGWSTSAWASVLSAGNDYVFYDDNGTPYTTSDDDPSAVRLNSDVARAEASLRASADAFALALDFMGRDAGVPGPGSHQDSDARLQELSTRASTSWNHAFSDHLSLKLTPHGELGSQRYRDQQLDVGSTGQDIVSDTWALGLETDVSWEPVSIFPMRVLLALGRESWQGVDLVQSESEEALRWRDRLTWVFDSGVDLEPGTASNGRFAASARVAADLARTAAEGSLPYSLDMEVEEPGTDALLGPSFGLSLALTRWWSLRLSGGRYNRLPTFPELYGDQGGVVGNAELKPERALSIDGGADLAGTVAGGALTGAVTLYHRLVYDYITYVQNSQYTLMAENYQKVGVSGLELELAFLGDLLSLGQLEAGLAWSLTRTRNLSDDPVVYGKALPWQPLNDLYLDLEFRRELLEPGATLEYDDGNFRDSANLFSVPPRAFLHLRLALSPGGRWPRFCLEVRNVTDNRVEYMDEILTLETGEAAPQAISDYWGFPLPGRSVYMSLSWSPLSR